MGVVAHRTAPAQADERAHAAEDRVRELQAAVEQLERYSEARLGWVGGGGAGAGGAREEVEEAGAEASWAGCAAKGGAPALKTAPLASLPGAPGMGTFGAQGGSGQALAALLERPPEQSAGEDAADRGGRASGDDDMDTPEQATTPLAGSTSSSLTRILMAQRDRLRARVREVEAEAEEAQRKAEAAERAREELEQDNVRLYKKLKYVQAYREEALAGTRGGQDVGTVESKYRRIYAAHADPFATFSQQERQQQYASLNMAEKVTLRCARSALSSRVGRHLVFAYALILHLMVFAMMAHMTHGPTPCPVHARHSFTTVERGGPPQL